MTLLPGRIAILLLLLPAAGALAADDPDKPVVEPVKRRVAVNVGAALSHTAARTLAIRQRPLQSHIGAAGVQARQVEAEAANCLRQRWIACVRQVWKLNSAKLRPLVTPPKLRDKRGPRDIASSSPSVAMAHRTR